MIHFQKELRFKTRGRGLLEITDDIRRIVNDSGIVSGMCHLFVLHTSASLIIQENADPSVVSDLETYLDKLAPENDPDYRHTLEGPDDMPAHIRVALTGVSELVPVTSARLNLGTWQGIFLWEHRRQGRIRTVVADVFGKPG